MSKEKLGQEPAFPKETLPEYGQVGMSKRFYAACAAIQGILYTSSGLNIDGEKLGLVKHQSIIVQLAYEYADEILKQENK